MKKHAISTAIAALLGLALVWWLQPETNGGAGLVFAVCLLVCNAVAASFGGKPKQRRRSAAGK
jgi:uncharacterized membrane protein YccC